ncbi:MAG: hypothetical protein KDC98_00090, partial [Planctomycetes bacterium]|nr:hypothetical protein [Planctomycetota bacterium]
RVPSLVPADPLDFRRGHSRDDGLLAELNWRPGEEWAIRAEGRDFGSDGVLVHELVPERSRQASASVEWQREPARATLSARHRHNDNEVSGHRLDSYSIGLDGAFTAFGATWSAGYTFARIETRTRTNFFFDPDPNPVPTLVGFDGETHTWQAAASVTPADAVSAEIGAVVTNTAGSYSLLSVDLRAELRWRCLERGTAGVEWRHMQFEDADEVDNWNADLIFLFWSHEW